MMKLAILAASAIAEKKWLAGQPFNEAHMLEVREVFTVTDTADLTLDGPITLTGVPPAGLYVGVYHADRLKEFQTDPNFCSGGKAVDFKQDSKLFEISDTTLRSGSEMRYKLELPGIWFLALVNCGSEDTRELAFSGGEVSVVTSDGWLGGEEKPKLKFYLILAISYFVLTLGWGILCMAKKDVAFKIHYFVGAALLAGFIEALCWSVSYIHWNSVGHRWWSMIMLAALGTVCKQALCYSLFIMVCRGVGITCSEIDSSTLLRLWLCSIGFILTEGLRLVMLLVKSITKPLPMTTTFAVVVPGAIFTSLFLSWAVHALNNTVDELEEQKQMAKLKVFRNMRTGGLAVLGFFGLVGIQDVWFQQSLDYEYSWKSRWIYSDALSHSAFFLMTLALCFVWQPSESSKNIMYSLELNAEEGIEMGGPESAEADVTLE